MESKKWYKYELAQNRDRVTDVESDPFLIMSLKEVQMEMLHLRKNELFLK